MSLHGCLKCNIVYTMVSDSCDTPMCKKCGGNLSYFNHDFDSEEVQYDSMWSSIGATIDDIDPNYIPESQWKND